MDNREFFKVKLDIDGLNEMGPPSSKACAGMYDVELIVDRANNNEIELKVFYDPKEDLGYKLASWEGYHEPDSLLSHFEVLETLEPDSLLNIAFSKYRIKGMTNSTNFYEFDLQYVVLRLTGIKKVYASPEPNICEVYLNLQSFHLIDLNYRYKPSFPWDEEYVWKPKNQISSHLPFGQIWFKPEHRMSNSKSEGKEEVTIKKEPRLSIKHENISEGEVHKHLSLLCTLYSFYSLENIDWKLARVFAESKLFIEIKDVKNGRIKDSHGLFRWDFFQDPMNLILNVDITFLLKNLPFFEKIVDRFIYSFNTGGESRFMILYSILEQIRNQYILERRIEVEKAGENPNLKKVVEEYSFTLSKTKTDTFIKEKIQEIATIVSHEDKERFINEAKYKIMPVKVISMINQFKSFFDYIEIDPEEYALNFNEIKSLRDSIFHGRPVEENLELLTHVNKYSHLPRFVGIVILKYAGIHDLNGLTKIEYPKPT